MIREMGNVELFELCETIPNVQCSECFLCWNQRIVSCTCGHLLVESDSSQNFDKWRLDALSTYNCDTGHELLLLRGQRYGTFPLSFLIQWSPRNRDVGVKTFQDLWTMSKRSRAELQLSISRPEGCADRKAAKSKCEPHTFVAQWRSSSARVTKYSTRMQAQGVAAASVRGHVDLCRIQK